MQQFPETLVLHLKRLQCDCTTSIEALAVRTIDNQVRVDEMLQAGIQRYALKSVVRHIGAYHKGGGAGHYFTFCKFPSATEQWWFYNDSDRRLARVADYQDANFKAYVVIYDRIPAPAQIELANPL